MTAAVTQVELTFAELGLALTRVAVEHRGWEQLTDEQLAKDCGLARRLPGRRVPRRLGLILRCLTGAVEEP